MDKVSKAGKMLLVVGDFNVWADVDGDKEAENLLDLMNAYGMMQQIHEPTHREGHTLDHVYVNPYQLNAQHTVINEPLDFTTDHFR